jgi:hypothetical protein
MENRNVRNNPTGAKALLEANVNTEFSSQTNILANMEGDVKGRDVLINRDSPSGTLERDSKETEMAKSPGKENSNDSVDGFQRFDKQEVSAILIFYVEYNETCMHSVYSVLYI